MHLCSRSERYDWTDDQVWDVITNDGKSVDPFVMLHAPTFKTLNPLCMPDWASQGIEYVDDMEDWVSQEGLWMSQEDYASASAHGSDDDDDGDGSSWVRRRLLDKAACIVEMNSCRRHTLPTVGLASHAPACNTGDHVVAVVIGVTACF